MSLEDLIGGNLAKSASIVNDQNVCASPKANTVFIYCSYKPKQQVGWLSELIHFLIGESFTDEDQGSVNASKMNPDHPSTCDFEQMNQARIH